MESRQVPSFFFAVSIEDYLRPVVYPRQDQRARNDLESSIVVFGHLEPRDEDEDQF